MKNSLRAILFDFDGVIANTEPVHLRLFQEVLRGEGLDLTESDYQEKYLGLDDAACFEAVSRDQERGLSPEKKKRLVLKKNAALLAYVQGKSLILPGVHEFLERVTQRYYLAIVSGALRNEIQSILTASRIDAKFHLIVSAEDVQQGKPDPEGFETAVRRLNRDHVPTSEILLPQECLAIEDSPWGIEASHKAGMKCLAVMTSYPRERLAGADLVVPNLRTVKWEEVEALFSIAPSSG